MSQLLLLVLRWMRLCNGFRSTAKRKRRARTCSRGITKTAAASLTS